MAAVTETKHEAGAHSKLDVVFEQLMQWNRKKYDPSFRESDKSHKPEITYFQEAVDTSSSSA